MNSLPLSDYEFSIILPILASSAASSRYCTSNFSGSFSFGNSFYASFKSLMARSNSFMPRSAYARLISAL